MISSIVSSSGITSVLFDRSIKGSDSVQVILLYLPRAISKTLKFVGVFMFTVNVKAVGVVVISSTKCTQPKYTFPVVPILSSIAETW